MDSLTHAAIGIGVYATFRSVLPDDSTVNQVTMLCVAVAGAEIPDIDVAFSWLKGPVAYLYQHRQISHSLPMWFIYSLFIGLVGNWFDPSHFWLFTLLAFVGTLTHVGTDILTTYGTLAFWPIASKRLRGDTLFTVEFGYLFLLLFGLIVMERHVLPWRDIVLIADMLAVVLTLWRAILHTVATRRLYRYAERHVSRPFPGIEADEHVAYQMRAVPNWLPLLRGYLFTIQRGHRLYFGKFDKRGQPVQEAATDNVQNEAVLHAVKQSQAGRAMRWFAPILYTAVREEGNRTVVMIADASVRCMDMFPFSAFVDMDCQSGKWRVLDEGLRAQALEAMKLWRANVTEPTQITSLRVLSPKGYRSKV